MILRFLLGALAVLLIAGPSLAAPTPEQACRTRVAKEGQKYFKKVYKARQRCLDNAAKGSLPGSTDCATEPKTALKITKAGDKLDEKIRKSCIDAYVASGSFAGACSSASTVDDLVTCIGNSHTNAVESLLPDLGGVSLVGLTDAQKCRKTMGTRFRKVADKRMKEARKCLDSVDKGKLPASTNCITVAEASEKLAKFEEKAEEKVAAACGDGPLSPLATAELPAPCDTDYSSRFYGCYRCNISTLTNGLLQAQGVFEDSLVGLEPATGACIPRTTAQVVLDQEQTINEFGASLDLDFYRNTAYACGLSGNYTFLVIEPANNPGSEAPLWVYLHGGAVGYYDDEGTYQAGSGLDEHRWNHEETLTDFQDLLLVRILDGNGQPEDQTLKRRIEEGYRLLVVAMCDHDWYSGIGTPYPNNPVGGQVNGLQATMAAVDYAATNYPTTEVWAHGTSAGSLGVWSLASSYSHEGKPLTGIVADSVALLPNFTDVLDAYLLTGQLNYPSTWSLEELTEKIGYYADLDTLSYPEAQIVNDDFRATAGLWIAGNVDPALAGHLPPVAQATAAGFSSNPQYLLSGLVQAIDDQANSPHELHNLPSTGHVPTNNPGPANDIVNDFIDKVLATSPPPFGD